jgi:hypothetical protein
MNAIVKDDPPEPPIASGPTFYRMSTDAAGLCRDIVLATATKIQGRGYVQVEGWQAIAIAHGCAASSGDVVRHADGSISATGRVVRMDDGVTVASAEGYVGADEPTWFGGKNAYGKTLPKRPDYAIRAMAQTRAISRACRSAFAHVVVMMNAGLSTTPAEEMGDGEEPAPKAALAAPKPEETKTTNPLVEWLIARKAELDAMTTQDQYNAFILVPDVKDFLSRGPEKARARLEEVMRDTLARIAAAPAPARDALNAEADAAGARAAAARTGDDNLNDEIPF